MTSRTGHKYSHLLSPIKIGNKLIKNRMIHTVGSPPHFLQGPETFPSDIIRSFYANLAKSAAIVSMPGLGGPGSAVRDRRQLKGDSAHMPMYDNTDPGVENYMDQLIESIHSFGALVNAGGVGGNTIEETVTRAKILEDRGIDMVNIGGDIRDINALGPTMEKIQAIKKATKLIIGWRLHVIHPDLRLETSDEHTSAHSTLQDAIALAKIFEGSVDILGFRLSAMMNSHPNGINQEEGKPGSLFISEAIKASGAKILLAPNGGFFDPDLNEEYLAAGKCDFITMTRAFTCDPEYGKKVYEDRGEDIAPCVMCNRCHGGGSRGPWIGVCSVNPTVGLEAAASTIDAPTTLNKVAVIGGGPTGMQAAITAAKRGHKVTLYEKDGFLGGQLRHADFSPYKWPYKHFKNYLIRQVNKAGVKVLLNTEATPELIKVKGYDTVLAAIGAEPVIRQIPGADSTKIWNVVNVYGKEKELGKNVVIIGGGAIGAETGMYLAKYSHKVTLLTGEKTLVEQAGPHQSEILVDACEHMENFSFITEATSTSISDGKVTYIDVQGNERFIQADSVVVYAGFKPRQDEALKFSGSADRFFIIGDCTGKGGNVQKSIRSAFFMASQF